MDISIKYSKVFKRYVKEDTDWIMEISIMYSKGIQKIMESSIQRYSKGIGDIADKYYIFKGIQKVCQRRVTLL